MACDAAIFAAVREARSNRATGPADTRTRPLQTGMQAVIQVLNGLTEADIIRSYALGGATGAGLHGEPLATRDVDVFVFLDQQESVLIDLSPLINYCASKGYGEFDGEALLIDGLPVQFIVASSGLETEAVKQADILSDGNFDLRVILPEYLAALALKTGRPKDRARVVYLTALPQFNRDRFHQILECYGLKAQWLSWAQGLDLEP